MSNRLGLKDTFTVVRENGFPLASIDPVFIAVDALLDRVLEAFSAGDIDAYLSCFSESVIYADTDPSEEWNKVALQIECEMDCGKEIGRTSLVRRVMVVTEADTVVGFLDTFHSEKHGILRASGLAKKDIVDETWHVIQYVRSFGIPNEVVAEVVKLKKAYELYEATST